MAPVFKNVGERSTSENHHLVSLLWLVFVEVLVLVFLFSVEDFQKPVNNMVVDHPEKCDIFFLISSLVLGLLDQLQILWELYLIKFPGILTSPGFSSCRT